jgi:hypothetical protein
MGPADVIAKLIDATMDFSNDAYLSPQFDDQGFFHSVLLDKPERELMKLDSECRVFCAFYHRETDFRCTNGGWFNT